MNKVTMKNRENNVLLSGERGPRKRLRFGVPEEKPRSVQRPTGRSSARVLRRFPPTQEDVLRLYAYATRLCHQWQGANAVHEDFAVRQTLHAATITACCYAMLYHQYTLDECINKNHVTTMLGKQAVLYKHHVEQIHDTQTEAAEMMFNGLPLIALRCANPEHVRSIMTDAYAFMKCELEQKNE